jgi:methylmalonyl-CoA mutase
VRKIYIIPPKRVRYLSEIAENNRQYDEWVNKQEEISAETLYLSKQSKDLLEQQSIHANTRTSANGAGRNL